MSIESPPPPAPPAEAAAPPAAPTPAAAAPATPTPVLPSPPPAVAAAPDVTPAAATAVAAVEGASGAVSPAYEDAARQAAEVASFLAAAASNAAAATSSATAPATSPSHPSIVAAAAAEATATPAPAPAPSDAAPVASSNSAAALLHAEMVELMEDCDDDDHHNDAAAGGGDASSEYASSSSSTDISSPPARPTEPWEQQQPLHDGRGLDEFRCSEHGCLTHVESYCLECGYQCAHHEAIVHAQYTQHPPRRTLTEHLQERFRAQTMLQQYRDAYGLGLAASYDPRAAAIARAAERRKARIRQRHTRGYGRGNSRRVNVSSSVYSKGFEPSHLLFDPELTWAEWSMRYLVRPLVLATIQVLADRWMNHLWYVGVRRWTPNAQQEVQVTRVQQQPTTTSQQQQDGSGKTMTEIMVPIESLQTADAPAESTSSAAAAAVGDTRRR